MTMAPCWYRWRWPGDHPHKSWPCQTRIFCGWGWHETEGPTILHIEACEPKLVTYYADGTSRPFRYSDADAKKIMDALQNLDRVIAECQAEYVPPSEGVLKYLNENGGVGCADR